MLFIIILLCSIKTRENFNCKREKQINILHIFPFLFIPIRRRFSSSKSTLPIGFVIGKSFQLAAFSEAAFVPVSSMARALHPPVSLPLRPHSSFCRPPAGHELQLAIITTHLICLRSSAPLPFGEGRGGASRAGVGPLKKVNRYQYFPISLY